MSFYTFKHANLLPYLIPLPGMAGNTFGTLFRLSTFGESHGTAIGGIIDGCPAGLTIDLPFITSELQRRKPGQSSLTSPRKEEDAVEFLSGVFEGKSLGTPIGFVIRNKDQQSGDYDLVKQAYRPSHADYTYEKKFGLRDYRGGGRSSARETACRIVAGAIAKLILREQHIEVKAFVKQIGELKTDLDFDGLDLNETEKNSVRCPDPRLALTMISYLEDLKKEGDSAGGIVQCVILNAPVGLGEPVFDKLHAVLGHAMLSINAVKGFELGSGFNSIHHKGSQLNDEFVSENGQVKTKTNHSGGIQGGISNGMPIYFNVAFKPVASIMMDQQTLNTEGEAITLPGKGRHDPCVLPRAVPIVESMAAMVMADFLLLAKTNRL